MKNLLLAVFGIVIFVGTTTNRAEACSVLPVNATVQKNDLVGEALSEIAVSIEDVTSVEVSNYVGGYLWTPMCPEGLTSEASFTINFKSGEDDAVQSCTAVIHIAKQYVYKDGKPTFAIEIVQAPVCAE